MRPQSRIQRRRERAPCLTSTNSVSQAVVEALHRRTPALQTEAAGHATHEIGRLPHHHCDVGWATARWGLHIPVAGDGMLHLQAGTEAVRLPLAVQAAGSRARVWSQSM